MRMSEGEVLFGVKVRHGAKPINAEHRVFKPLGLRKFGLSKRKKVCRIRVHVGHCELPTPTF